MLLLGCGALHAQVSSAILSGTVADPSSAVITGATITASQHGTGFTRKALTDSRGEYKIEGLAPGVTATKRGFRDFEITGLTLEVNQHSRRDIQLTLGDSHARITVEGAVGSNIFDFSLARRFLIRDHGAMELRASSFNAFNHPNWGIPGPNPDFGPFFGKIFTSCEPRRIQSH